MISTRWIEQQEGKITLSKPGPRREELVRELEEAKALRAEQELTVARLAKAGYKRNQYAGTSVISGERVEPLTGFVRKDDNGRWVALTWDEAVQEGGAL